VGKIAARKTVTLALPASLFPADKIWVRLRARKTDKSANIQVNRYIYNGTVDNAPLNFTGKTTYADK
jgi:hypothetical protein